MLKYKFFTILANITYGNLQLGLKYLIYIILKIHIQINHKLSLYLLMSEPHNIKHTGCFTVCNAIKVKIFSEASPCLCYAIMTSQGDFGIFRPNNAVSLLRCPDNMSFSTV